MVFFWQGLPLDLAPRVRLACREVVGGTAGRWPHVNVASPHQAHLRHLDHSADQDDKDSEQCIALHCNVDSEDLTKMGSSC